MTLKKYQREISDYKNTLVIMALELVLLRDVIFDKDDNEFYWVVDTLEAPKYVSTLVKYTVLKGYIPDEEYDELVRVWNLNFFK